MKRSSFWTLSHHIASLIFIASRLRNKLATVLLSISNAVIKGYFRRLSDIAVSPFSVLADGADSTVSGRTFHCKHHVDSLPQIGFLSYSSGNNLRRLSTGKQILTPCCTPSLVLGIRFSSAITRIDD